MATEPTDLTDDGPAAAFASLAHETRLDIIAALGDPDGPGRMPRLSFSELRERVGLRNSSQFNYHLSELTGHYVAEEETGYVLTYPGLLVWIAMRKGAFADPDAVTVDPFPLDAPCRSCGALLAGRYEAGGLEVACPSCGTFHVRRPLSPATAADASGTHLLDAAGRSYVHELALRREGVCPVCKQAVAPRLVDPGTVDGRRDGRDLAVLAVHDCDHCAVHAVDTAGAYVLSHPGVRAFLRERGVGTARPWALAFAAGDGRTRVRSTDPWRVTVTVEAGGRERVAAVDGDLSVAFE